MSIFLTLLGKILPLYVYMALGYFGGRFLGMQRETVGTVLLYFFYPVVYFNAIVTSRMTPSTLSLPLLFLVLCCGMCLLFLGIGARVWNDATTNILAQTAGTGNYAYFAIPAAAAILPAQTGVLVVLSGVGFIAYENTLGFFVAARGNHSVREALGKLARLPALYAVAVALVINYLHVDVGQTILDAAGNFKGGFSVLGMMTIGLGLATIDFRVFRLDWTYVLLAFAARFLVWPLLMTVLVVVDSKFIGFYSAGGAQGDDLDVRHPALGQHDHLLHGSWHGARKGIGRRAPEHSRGASAHSARRRALSAVTSRLRPMTECATAARGTLCCWVSCSGDR